jgi:1-acyl-sn-glycerol-3-phosphate acyltransferase
MIRSILFNLFYVTWTLLVGIIFWPTIFLPQHIIILVVGKIWARGLEFFLRISCNLSIDAKGLNNIPNQPAIFASKHQSALETFMFHLLLDKPVFVLKQELLDIPVFGYYLKKMGMIAIDRSGGIKSLKLLLKQVEEKIKQGHSIIIFPEGTRVEAYKTGEYNAGVAAIYNLKVAPLIPVALNTGYFWPRNSFHKKPGKFTIEFLPALPNDLPRKDFINILKDKIETSSRALLP